MSGRVYLVPNLLGAIAPQHVLPARTIEIARTLEHWAVETPKAARAFLKTLEMPMPIAALSIEALGEAPSDDWLRKLLAPVAAGADLGVLSDAGCPGVADPGAQLVAAAHALGMCVVPLVGPSSLVLALMAAGMNGQRFAFQGYLPVGAEARAQTLRSLEAQSRSERCTQIFIETPFRNVAMLETLFATLRPETRLCVACDLTLPTESVVSQPIAAWRKREPREYARRPAIFLLHA